MLANEERPPDAPKGEPARPARPSFAASQASAVAREVQALDDLDLEGLRAHWRRRFGEVPKLRSPELLRLMLAWKIQASAWGGLDGSVRRRLRRTGAEDGSQLDLPVGSRLGREWQGVLEEVDVTSEGYVWRGQSYPSLSAVARAITGTRWNGPRFFGLRGEGT
jgi:hypothetical protein